MFNTPDLYTETEYLDWRTIHGSYICVFDLFPQTGDSPVIHMQHGEESRTRMQQPYNLPPQDVDSCRVYFVHDATYDKNLEAHIKPMIPDTLPVLSSNQCLSTKPPLNLNRRLEDGQMPWWQDGICTFGSKTGSKRLFKSLIRCHISIRYIWQNNRMICTLKSPLISYA